VYQADADTANAAPVQPVTTWLIATHALLCLAAFLSHLSRYPPYHSLFYWWLAPADLIGLCVVTPIFLVVPRMAAVLNLLITVVESIALAYLGIKSLNWPMTLDGPATVAGISALIVVARGPLGWSVALASVPEPAGRRGCHA